MKVSRHDYSLYIYIYGKIKNVPNHLPVVKSHFIHWTQQHTLVENAIHLVSFLTSFSITPSFVIVTKFQVNSYMTLI